MGFELAVVATAFAFGLRHGIDWDHLAAITDIAGSQRHPRTSLTYCTLYAAGHAVMVIALGLIAIAAGDFIPPVVDAAMERLVGITLIMLGGYLLYSFFRDGGADLHMRSRWMLVVEGLRKVILRRRTTAGVPVVIDHEHEHPANDHHFDSAPLVALPSAGSSVAVARKTHKHPHVHVGAMPQDPFVDYGSATAFGVGVLHGVGAETPTQVLLFVTAAGVEGRAVGLLLLLAFVVGLFVSNTLLAVISTFGMNNRVWGRRVFVVITLLSAAFSFAIGAVMLLGKGSVLPGLFA